MRDGDVKKYSVEQLVATIIAMENLEDASTALIHLSKKNKSLAYDLALSIFNEYKGDVFFQAVAFEMLYSLALPIAVEYIKYNSSKVDVYLLGVMLSFVTEDSGLLEINSLIMDAVRYL